MDRIPNEPDPGESRETPTINAAELLQSDLVGIWSDRTDLGDSREFARRLREEAQTRRTTFNVEHFGVKWLTTIQPY